MLQEYRGPGRPGTSRIPRSAGEHGTMRGTMRGGDLTGMRPGAAIALGKVTATLSRRLQQGGGTTMPGRVARAVEPRLLPLLSRRLRHGSVIVAGTNGKTTTARLLAHIMREAGPPPPPQRARAHPAAGGGPAPAGDGRPPPPAPGGDAPL